MSDFAYPDHAWAFDVLPVYRVMTDADDASFCHRVSEALALGYRLHAGPALTFDGTNVIVAQAVIWPQPPGDPAPGQS